MTLAPLAVAAALLLTALTPASVQAQEQKSVQRKAEPAQKVGALAASDDEKAERSRRALDAQAERLEREARKVMTTICRGC